MPTMTMSDVRLRRAFADLDAGLHYAVLLVATGRRRPLTPLTDRLFIETRRPPLTWLRRTLTR